MKTPYTYRAEKFIKILFPYIKEELEKEFRSIVKMDNCVNNFNNQKKRRVLFNCGASRAVFINNDYVVKVDIKPKSWAGNCEDEYRMYKFAQRKGFDYLFAPITRIEYYGYFFYIMPRVHNISIWRDEEDFYKNLDEKEYDFINDFINDIHGGNFGYLNKKMVLIDYAWNNFSH